MDFQTQSDDAVSPVVAVILMVAVTVILSAVIGTFVLDLGGSVNQNPQAGVAFDQVAGDNYDADGDGTTNEAVGYNVTVDVVSLDSADSLTIKYLDSGSSEETWENDGNTTTTETYAPADATLNTSSVGDSLTMSHVTPGDKITVIGHLDGKNAVLQTHTVEG